jgi:hypothetical protein
MLRALSKEEELQLRREGSKRLKPGSLFNLGQERFFIALKKVDEKVWEVVELTQENRERIITGQPCEHSNLHFDEINYLNIKG